MHLLHAHELFKTQFQWGISFSFVSCLDYLELNRITVRVIQIMLENFDRQLKKKTGVWKKLCQKFSLCAIKQPLSPFLPPSGKTCREQKAHRIKFISQHLTGSNTLNTSKKNRLTIDSPQTTEFISCQTVTSRELLKNFIHYAGIMLDALTIALCPKRCQYNLSDPNHY